MFASPKLIHGISVCARSNYGEEWPLVHCPVRTKFCIRLAKNGTCRAPQGIHKNICKVAFV